MASKRSCMSAMSAARLFVQLSNRPCPSTHTLLDVLAPAQARAMHLAAPRLLPGQASRSPVTSQPYSGQAVVAGHQSLLTSARLFSSTTRQQATQAIFNAQEDDDGKDMLLEITPRAAKRLQQIMTKDGNPNLALRIQVESGGCHGFQYIMSLTTLPTGLPSSAASLATALKEGKAASTKPSSLSETIEEVTPSTTTSSIPSASSLGEDDTVFAYVPEAAEQPAAQPCMAKIVLDKPSLDLLKGSKVDYTMELIGSQFKIVDNPYATSSCGCGTSFDIKM
ncbi:hypothetical protein Micbo1qcDRAFT_159887 [Microdochium bolleyi]|uniref:FeS cluster biogenesis domain-containing protein n=1 Tax=Microdochium bolleyi TaxID=196109 RepID=A0A136JBV1_9PEZI|nr:hypothetical protein Micbo1qcDRAFT_159887 [Microdochium bolleyi]